MLTRMTVAGLLSAALGLTPGNVAMARTWLVPQQAPTIGAGIDSAAVGDTVQVACGTYFEPGLLMKPGITLRSENGSADCVVIDGQEQGRILDCLDLSEPAVIEGITFRAGVVGEGWLGALGGGVRCQNSQVIIADCRFQENSARIGGGLGVLASQVTLTDCEFAFNAATHAEFAAGGGIWIKDSVGSVTRTDFQGNSAFSTELPGDGGGLFTNNSHLVVSECSFTLNSAGAGAGGFYSLNYDSTLVSSCVFSENSASLGAAVYLETSYAQLEDCAFTDNTAASGGAMVIERDSVPVIRRCRFEANATTEFSGGAIDCWYSEPVFEQCTFIGNNAVRHGGAINFGGSQAQLVDCLFGSNTAGMDGGGIRTHFTDFQLTNCTFVANAGVSGGGFRCGHSSSAVVNATIIAFSAQGEGAVSETDGAIQITCSDLFGNAGGDWVGFIADQVGINSNISADPLFCSLAEADYRLADNSPCGPDSNSFCGLMGALELGCGTVAAPDAEVSAPALFRLEQNFPNPFNPHTTIRFVLSEANPTTVVIFDTAGRKIRTLLSANLPASTHAVTWNGRDDADKPVAAGVYFYRVVSGGHHAIGRMALIR